MTEQRQAFDKACRTLSLSPHAKEVEFMNIEKAITAFESNGFKVTYFETSQEATQYLDSSIDGKSVGFGDSGTLQQMNLFKRLSTHNKVVDPQNCVYGKTFLDTARECLMTDIFLTSVNASSETGELVNIDGTGNRVAGSLFGHKKVYFLTRFTNE